MKVPVLSVITVSKDCGSRLISTFESLKPLLRDPTCKIEWIIVDGCSKDETLGSIVEIAREEIKNIRYTIESDRGIYDAMNKGIGLSRGEFIMFMNAGDRILRDNISRFIDSKPQDSQIVAYGYLLTSQKSKYLYRESWLKVKLQDWLSRLRVNLPTSHNSMIYPCEIARKMPYTLGYRCGADFEQYLSFLKGGVTVERRIWEPICIIDKEGYISKNIESSYMDYIEITRTHGLRIQSIYWTLRLAWRRTRK